ncbi:MAG: SufD family Fe-S cluster assembly protein [Clostridia bacterium]|nr:SufD family Fe-S cluster assembly protein [Clostridia bacterium]
MDKLSINEIPIRTANNFGINSIEIENINIPENFGYFSNIDINIESIKDKVNFSNQNYRKLTYGLGEVLETQNKEKCNCPLKVDVSSILNKEIKIDFLFNQSNRNLAENIEIIANEKTKSTIVLTYQSDDEINYYHNGVIRVLAKEKTEVNVIILNFMGSRANNFLSIENELQDNSKVTYTIIDFGGKVSCTNFFSNVLGEESITEINTIYLGKDKKLFDLNYIAELSGKKSASKMEVQGALMDSSVKHFKGTINFKKGCKKAFGTENESCMLLSEKAKSISLPILLCSEEEVEGNHSTSSGKVGDKELFYIRSRGFDLMEAKKLLVRAKFNSIIENIKNDVLKEMIENEINKTFAIN